MLKEWNKWKEFNAVKRITKDEAQPLIDSGEAEVIPTQWIHTDRNEVLRLQGGVDVPEDLKSRLVACGQFEKADVRSDSPTAPQEGLHLLCSFCASRKVKMKTGDIVNAYFHGGKLTRTLLMRQPRGGVPDPEWDPTDLMPVVVPIYE